MPSNDDLRRHSAERARALLAVLDVQPPPDFAIQVLARVYALQARRAPHPVPYARPLPSLLPSHGWRSVCWPVKRQPRLSGLSIMACGLAVASVVLLWCVSTRSRPAGLPEEARPAYTALQPDMMAIEDRLDGAGRSTAALQEVAAAVEPVPQPGILFPPSREAQRDKGDRARAGEHAVPPAAPMVPSFPGGNREALKRSAQTQEQRSGPRRGLRGKAKRSGKGLRLSRHMPT